MVRGKVFHFLVHSRKYLKCHLSAEDTSLHGSWIVPPSFIKAAPKQNYRSAFDHYDAVFAWLFNGSGSVRSKVKGRLWLVSWKNFERSVCGVF
jgi:hypothetical protein